ncbi:MAG: asparagine synthase-related protein [Polyangiaceae bacterium]
MHRRAFPRAERDVRRLARRERPSACAPRSTKRPRSCASSAPTCRWGATCRAGSTARSSRRWRSAGAKEARHLLPCDSEDAEYDETSFQRAMAERLESDHHGLVVSRGDIARAFPRVVAHAEKPLLRTAPAPLFLLSGLVHDAGIKVVLTGEGADEMFAGYDLFREAKVRRYWAKQPASTRRPELLQRLYPYLARSPVAQRAMAQKFFGRGLEHAHSPTFAHETRWQSAAALKRLFSKAAREAIGARDAVAELVADLPPDFAAWTPLARDQHLEIRTLLSSYILCSQGDRMLMAHSVEGRFPFLDVNVAALAASLPPAYKLKVLDEKHVLKRAARNLVLPDIVSARSSLIARRTRCRSSAAVRRGSRTRSLRLAWPPWAFSSRRWCRPCGRSSASGRTTPSSPTPTTWPSWACSPRSSSAPRSSALPSPTRPRSSSRPWSTASRRIEGSA